MRHEIRKIAKITEELLIFFLEQGSNTVHMDVKENDEGAYIQMTAKRVQKMEETVEALKDYLSYPREKEVEEYYWELTGDNESVDELGLVGSMVDEATLDYEEDTIHLELIRKK